MRVNSRPTRSIPYTASLTCNASREIEFRVVDVIATDRSLIGLVDAW